MTQNNIRIAVTGGIGSGKSTVLSIIKNIGYKVISLDNVYAQLLEEREFKSLIASEFGDVFSEEGNLDRAKLSKIVFSDRENLKRLNSLTHPLIYERAFSLAENYKLCFFEVPLLFESGGENKFDEVLVVLRDIESRISSVKLRDNASENEVKNRINSQFDYNLNKLSKYYVIHNNCNINHLSTEIEKIILDLHRKYGI